MEEIRVRPEDRPAVGPYVAYASVGIVAIGAFAWFLTGASAGSRF